MPLWKRSQLQRSNSVDGQLRHDRVHSLLETSAEPLHKTQSNAAYDGVSVEKRVSEITALKADNDLKKAETVVVVMGPTGVGKSRFIKEATGADVDVGDSLYSSTSTVQAFHFMLRKRSFALVDTPGFDDTVRSDAQVFRELAAWLAARYQEKTRLTSILYMQRISDPRVSGSILRNLTVMKRMLGVQSFPHLTLVTSMWDTVESGIAESRERQLKQDFWSDLVRSGAHTGRFNGSQKSAHQILQTIATSGLSALALVIQRELVDDRIPLARTTAGIFLASEMSHGDPAQNEEADNFTQKVGVGTHDQLEASWDPEYGSLWLEESSDVKNSWDTNVYRRLKEDEFRLVKLSAGSGQLPIEIAITCGSLKCPPRYAALSYVVGKNQQGVCVNFRDGATVSERMIAENLHAALMQLRRASVDIMIWVDQLCINQEDEAERAEQVRNMSKIFSCADNVCIWLGLGDARTDAALRLASRILDLDELESALCEPQSVECFMNLAGLMASPWFSRRWCVQELLLARSATIHCGSKVMKWADFADAASLLATRWQHLQNTSEGGRIAHAELVPAIVLVDLSKEIVRRTEEGEIIEYLMDLECLLWRLATFDVTVLHDTIYAIHDLAKDLIGKRRIRIDYTLAIADLFRDVTELIVRSSGALDIICRPWAPLSGLPSWIPTVSKTPYIQVKGGYHFERQNGDSLVGTPSSTRYKACGDYSARGSTSFRSEGVHNILAVQGVMVAAIGQVGGECINGNIPRRWMEMAGWAKIHETSAPEHFWRILVADRTAQGLKAPDWYRRACDTAFRHSQTVDIDTKRVYTYTNSANVREFLRRLHATAWSRSLATLDDGKGSKLSNFWNQASARRKQQLCLCPPDTREGDIVVVLYGCSVPVVLRSLPPYYHLVGECFVLGLMNGEAMRDPKVTQRLNVYDLI